MQQPSRRLLIGLAYVGFVSLGLPDGLLGVAWPSIRTFFHLPLDALGTLLVMFTVGYLVSSCSSGRLLARLNVGALLALSCVATAISLLGYALTPQWWIMVVLGLLSGLGAGAIDAGVNTYAATHYSARTVNWLHACYGIGATGGPVIMTSCARCRLSLAVGLWDRRRWADGLSRVFRPDTHLVAADGAYGSAGVGTCPRWHGAQSQHAPTACGVAQHCRVLHLHGSRSRCWDVGL